MMLTTESIVNLSIRRGTGLSVGRYGEGDYEAFASLHIYGRILSCSRDIVRAGVLDDFESERLLCVFGSRI